SPTAHEVIPGSFSELTTTPSRAHWATTRVWDTAAHSRYRFETWALLLHPRRAIVGRPAFLSSPAAEAARFIGRRFSGGRFSATQGGTGGITRVVGPALFWCLDHRAG